MSSFEFDDGELRHIETDFDLALAVRPDPDDHPAIVPISIGPEAGTNWHEGGATT